MSTFFAIPQVARSAETIMGGPTPFGIPTRAWVQHPQLVPQQCPEWCFAASIAMIFSCYGHPIDQKRIVERLWGQDVCAPAFNTSNIEHLLSDTWRDDAGVDFSSTVVAAYDAYNYVNSINNTTIVEELENDHPLLYCNTHHAMVVVSVDYMNQAGPNQSAIPGRVDAVGVLDPFTVPAFHLLSPAEIVPAHLGGQMTFLATVRIL
jgi:hypothetical protein